MQIFTNLANLIAQSARHMLLITLGMAAQTVYGLLASLPSFLEVVWDFLVLCDRTISYMGYWEFLSMIYVVAFATAVWFAWRWLLKAYCNLISRKGAYPDVTGVKLKDFKYFPLDDGRGISPEAAFSDGTFCVKAKKLPDGVVEVYVAYEEDGIFSPATPTFRGFATRCGNEYITAEHVIAPARGGAKKVFVSNIGTGNCVEVSINERLTQKYAREDIGFLNGGKTFTLLGVKNPKWGIFTPTMGTDVLSYDFSSKTFSISHDQAEWNPTHDDPFLCYTRSNTHTGDSGLPIRQGGYYVGVHIGAKVSRKRNAHVATPFVCPKEFERLARSNVGDVETADLGPDENMEPIYAVSATHKEISPETPFANQYRNKQRQFAEEARRHAEQLEDEQREYEAAVAAEMSHEQEFFWKQKRSAGLDVDDQGFRKARTSQRAVLNTRDDRGNLKWGDLDDDDVVFESSSPVDQILDLNRRALVSAKQVHTPRPSPNSSPKMRQLGGDGGGQSTSGVKTTGKENLALEKSTGDRTDLKIGENQIQSASLKITEKPSAMVVKVITPKDDSANSKRKSKQQKLKERIRQLEEQVSGKKQLMSS